MKTLLAFIVLLLVIITIHEFGHFITAKLFGVYVHEFSIGMGPVIWSKKGKETAYQVRAVPIGGFVSMAGEEVNANPELDEQIPESRKFSHKPYYQKIIILLAGVTMNFLLAIAIFTGLLLSSGVYAEPIKSTVTGLTEGFPAEKAGFEVGDKIIKIENKNRNESMQISDFMDLQVFNHDITDQDVLIYTVDRNGSQLELEVSPQWSEEQERYLVGIQGTSENLHDVSWYNAPWYGFRYFCDQTVSILKSFRVLFLQGGVKQLSGPVGIATVTGEATKSGLLTYLSLIGLLSLNIGIMNLLPLPVLDGGQIVIETIQKIIGRPLNDKLKLYLMGGCWIILLIIFGFVTWNDIVRLIKG